MVDEDKETVWNNASSSIDDVVTQEKNPHAAALGRLGGKKGGPARAMRLSAERRIEIARQAAQTRWHGGQIRGESGKSDG